MVVAPVDEEPEPVDELEAPEPDAAEEPPVLVNVAMPDVAVDELLVPEPEEPDDTAEDEEPVLVKVVPEPEEPEDTAEAEEPPVLVKVAMPDVADGDVVKVDAWVLGAVLPEAAAPVEAAGTSTLHTFQESQRWRIEAGQADKPSLFKILRAQRALVSGSSKAAMLDGQPSEPM